MGFLARLRARLVALLSPSRPREPPEPPPAPALPQPAPAAPPVAPPQQRRDRERRRLAAAEARAAAAEERAKQSGQRLKAIEAREQRAPEETRKEKRRARRTEAEAREAADRIRAAEERARDAVERERRLTGKVMELEARLEEATERAKRAEARAAEEAPPALAAPAAPAPPGRAPAAEVAFSPGDSCLQAIRSEIARARRSIDACVFTITDDRIASALLDAHRRGVKVRVITDNDKSLDEGSDVDRLARAGIPVRKDLTEYHMHHKFAVFDGRVMLTGSYNWTRGAARYNEENLIVSDDPRLCEPFAREFEELWRRLGPGPGGGPRISPASR